LTSQTILILGGYGNTGLALARLLLAASDVQLILAGRTLSRAQDAAAQLNAEFAGRRVIGAYADATDPASLRQAMDGVPMVVVCSSTAAYAQQVAEAALALRSDYFDVQYSTTKLATLEGLAPDMVSAGRCFITEGGFHPGLPAAMVRYVAPGFDRLESAIVASVIKINWSALQLSPSTLDEFVGEFRDFQTLHLKDGRWQNAGLAEMMMPQPIDFGDAWGRQPCLPMFLEELRCLPESYPYLRELGFFVGGFNWFVDWFLSPIILGVLKVAPQQGIRPMARWMRWGLNRFSRPPYGTLLRLEARGVVRGLPKVTTVSIAHPDGYQLTAIPAAACLLQYLDGSIRKPGLWLQAHVVEPKRFMHDLARLGAEVHLNETGHHEAHRLEIANPT
jgi:hypothetical protein